MKKLLVILFCLMMILGCQKTEDNKEELSIIVPSGTPSLSLIEYVKNHEEANVTIVDGSDALNAAFLNVNEEYDAIIAPLNLVANMYLKGSNYRLLGIVTLGNSYLIANKDLVDSDKPLAAFGENTIIGKVVKDCLDLDSFNKEVIYYSSLNDVVSAFLSQEASYALVSEPALTTIMKKAESLNIEVEIIKNIQDEFSNKYSINTYPQAALFVNKEKYENKKDLFTSLENDLASLNLESMDYLENRESYFKISDAKIIKESYSRLNIRYIKAKEYQKEISTFLSIFKIEVDENFYVE